MQAGARVQHHVPRGQLHRARSVGVIDDEFAAVIGIRFREKQRGGQVRAHALGGTRDAPHRVVHVVAKGLAAFITVKQGREDLARQGG
ncbi:hypothetical protein D3C78_1418520 [compost metagenome]